MTQIESGACSKTLATLLAAAVLLAAVSSAAAATLFVANYGVDSGSCGSATSRCRSITQAIANALPDDSISVGPGFYGDLDGDNVLGETGEEVSGVCDFGTCLVRVDKKVKIFSTDGAGATVLRAPSSLGLGSVVSIESAGAELGRVNQGFTLSGAQIQVLALQADGAKIVGNRIAVGGSGAGIDSFSSDILVVAKNVVVGDGTSAITGGIGIDGDGAIVSGNVVAAVGTGLTFQGTGIKATGNVAIGNGTGFRINISASAGAPAKFGRNSAIANLDAGIFVYGTDNPSGGATVALGRSNVFANGQRSGGLTPNCGIQAANDDITDPLTVNATGIFWGVASGPGANPADAIGGVCNSGLGSVTVNAPSPALKRIKVTLPAQR